MKGRFLVLGRAGHGKTHLILEKLIDFLRRNREDEIIFLLSTYGQAEHLRDYLFRKQKISGFFDQSLTTLSGLAERILEDYSARNLISEVEKDIILTEVLKNHHLSYFSLVQDFPGFKRALLDFIREVKENSLDPSQFEFLLQGLYRQKKTPHFRDKYNSLALIYRNYWQALEKRGRWDREDLLQKTLDKLTEEKDLLSDIKLLLVDGFHDYTPLQFKILEELISRIPTVYLSLTFDSSLSSPIFSSCRKTYQKLAALGFEMINLTQNRRASSFGLSRIEEGLAGKDGEAEEMDDSISIIEAATGEDEVYGIAGRIVELIKEEKFCFKDIGIIFRGVGRYVWLLESIFSSFRIPFRIYGKRSLKESPLIKAIMNFSRIFTENWKDQWILKTLKSGYFFSEQELIDELEYRLLARGAINCREGWLNLAAGLPEDKIRGFFRRLQEKEKEISERHSPQFFRNWYRKLTEGFINLTSDYKLAKDEASSLSAFYQTLDDLLRYLQTKKEFRLSFLQYFQILSPLIESSSFRGPDRRDDVVNIIDAGEARGWEIPIVFVGGLLEGEFPRPINEDIFLRDDERNLLNSKELFFKEAGDLRNEEGYLFYVALTRAKKRLYLTYPATDQRGGETIPSFFLEEAKKLFTGESLKEHTLFRLSFQTISRKEEIRSFSDLRNYLYYQLTCPSPLEEKEELLTIWLYNQRIKDARFREELKEVSIYPPLAIFGKPAKEAIKKGKRIFNYSELYEYALCPYRHFAGYVLSLEGISTFTDEGLNYQKQGLIIHATLERFYREGSKGDISHIFEKVFSQKTEGMEMGPDEKRIKREMERTVKFFVEKEKEYLELYRCAPDRFEVRFGYGVEKPLEIVDEKLGKIGISGKIDRIDIGEVEGERVGIVIDYKYSKDSFNPKRWEEIKGGIDLQLPIYLMALKELFGIKPIGGEIYSLKDLKRGGIREESFVAKRVLPPSSGRNSVLLSSKEFEEFLERAKSFIIQYVRDILEGEIAPRPRKLDRCGAGVCDYADLCRVNKWELGRNN